MAITYAQIMNAMKTTLAAVPGVVKVEAYDNLSESIQDMPLIRLYPEKAAVLSEEAGQNTFGKGVQTTNLIVKGQVYVRQRSHIDEDHKAQIDMLDIISTTLESLSRPYFGVQGVQALGWEFELVTFTQGEGQSITRYPGLNFTLRLKIF